MKKKPDGLNHCTNWHGCRSIRSTGDVKKGLPYCKFSIHLVGVFFVFTHTQWVLILQYDRINKQDYFKNALYSLEKSHWFAVTSFKINISLYMLFRIQSGWINDINVKRLTNYEAAAVCLIKTTHHLIAMVKEGIAPVFHVSPF